MIPEQMLVLFLMGACASSAFSKQFIFINEEKTFADALTYCRLFHVDLASVESAEDIGRLRAAASGVTAPAAWIGLRKASPDWIWSLSDSAFYGEGEAEYRNWKKGQLDNAGGIEDCCAIDDSGEFWDTPCTMHVAFICYDGQAGVLQRYVLVTSALTWSEAQTFCRGKHTDLVSVRNLNENKLIQPLVPKDHLVYIGLYKDFYKWSDNSSSSFRRWSAGEPDSSGECVEQDLWDTNTWTDEDCSETKPFICQDGLKLQMLRVKLRSGVNVKDPVMKASILEEIQRKLINLGMPEEAKVQWRVQSDGEIFHLLENSDK